MTDKPKQDEPPGFRIAANCGECNHYEIRQEYLPMGACDMHDTVCDDFEASE